MNTYLIILGNIIGLVGSIFMVLASNSKKHKDWVLKDLNICGQKQTIIMKPLLLIVQKRLLLLQRKMVVLPLF